MATIDASFAGAMRARRLRAGERSRYVGHMDAKLLAYDGAGLVTVIVQDRLTGEVRMVAHANEAAIDATVSTGEGHFWSRSRGAPWRKGETSGNVLRVREVWADCDRDAVLYLVDAEGPSCHTGAQSCFFDEGHGAPPGVRAVPTLVRLEETLASRAGANAEKSYTSSLLAKGATHIGAKIREEADELARALEHESDERVVSEAADVLYHVMVGLLARGVSVGAVLGELARRSGTSGHDEKASR